MILTLKVLFSLCRVGLFFMIAGYVIYCSKLQITPLHCTKYDLTIVRHPRAIFKPRVLYILDVRGVTIQHVWNLHYTCDSF